MGGTGTQHKVNVGSVPTLTATKKKEHVDRWGQLREWSPEQRQKTQAELIQAGYLPKNYAAAGGLDKKFVGAFESYMNERNQNPGMPPINSETLAAMTPYTVKRGGGGSAPEPTFGVGALASRSIEELRMTMEKLYGEWTGGLPDSPSLDFVTNQALGGKAYFDIRQGIQNTPEFKTRYPNMPAGMDVKQYDSMRSDANAMALEIAGRPIKDHELGLLFADKGNELYDALKKG